MNYNWRKNRHLLIDVAVINPICSTNISNLLSDGNGAAATAYEKIKERIYRDLDFSKYEFLPFIIEASGGLGKAAHGFCKELKRRRESLNCNHDPDGAKRNFSDPLLVAISVELQRANCRMILERAPRTENLIESEVVKCRQSVALKRDEAIESLRLEALQPDRIRKWNKGRKSRKKMMGDSGRTPTVLKRYASANEPRKIKRSLNDKQKRKSIDSLQKVQMKRLTLAVPPEPPDGQREIAAQGGRKLHCLVEERHMAPKSCKSQVTSTSSGNVEFTPNNELKPIPWDPSIEHAHECEKRSGQVPTS